MAQMPCFFRILKRTIFVLVVMFYTFVSYGGVELPGFQKQCESATNGTCPAGYHLESNCALLDGTTGIGCIRCDAGTYMNELNSSYFFCLSCATNATSSGGASYCTCKTGYSGGGGTSDPAGLNCVATNTGCATNQIDAGGTCQNVKFTVTTTQMTANDTFKWMMSAAGTFYVDCGDDGVLSGTGVSGKTINRTNNTNVQQYTCTYPNAGTYTIKFGGAATGYNSSAGSVYAAIRFGNYNSNDDNTPTKIAGISGSLGAIFGTIGNGDTLSKQPRFAYTFNDATNMAGSIPSNLFTGITGAPAQSMFSYTFDGCSKLSGQIPATLFAGIHGAPASYMFSHTFSYCSRLTGSIPENLFAGVEGAPAPAMFYGTFLNCSGLTGSIPENLFAGVEGAPAQYMFGSTFFDCSGLTGSIPENMFAGVEGAPAHNMFEGTFFDCTGLTGSIPENLFAGISGAPVEYMFDNIFNGCAGLTGFTDGTTTISYVPSTFLANINTDTSVLYQASYMFSGTGLSNPCPANTYAVTREQFSDAGKPWCAPCPTGTHYNGTGATSVNQCCQSGYDWNGTTCALTEYTITYNLNGGTGCSNTTYTDSATLCTPARTGYTFDGWYDNVNLTGTAVTEIPTGSSGDKEYWAKWEQAKFTLTTTDTTDSFKFRMSAAGTFYVDCGDGGVLSGTGVSGNKIDRGNNTSDATYTCTYSAAGAHTLRFGGSADGYNASQAAIRFNISANPSSDENAEKIASISGSLGRIFRTRVNATVGNPQPKFIQTFSLAKNMICQIPADLFDGIYGSPVEAMFSSTFNGCSGLTGSIPETLFCQNPNNSGVNNCIYGAPAQNMFVFTFNGCSSLTGTDISDPYNPGKKYAIPPKLFVGISGDPASAMFKDTFQNCSKLAGTIPSGLFANIVGSPKEEMFDSTFRGCKKLTGSIPATLFSGISGAPAQSMFGSTFYDCSGLTGSISSDLFAGISGDPKSEMFSFTFRNCSGLNSITEGTKTTTYIPGTFLSSINTASASETGNPALSMFYGTNLDDSCPIGTRNVTRPPFDNAAKPWCALNTITLNWNENGGDAIANESCVYGDDLELPSAPTRTGYTFAGWKTADNVIRDAGTIITEGCTNTYTGVTQGYSTAITAQWTEIEYPFTLTTNSTDSFQFDMFAAGTFYVDCGNGGTLSGDGVSGNTITRSDVAKTTYTCSWNSSAPQTIRFGGRATGYFDTTNNELIRPAIKFNLFDDWRILSNDTNVKKITGISGSLGQIFPTLSNPNVGVGQPNFIYTFSNASNMYNTDIDDPNNPGKKYALPPNLFDGIYGAPVDNMFIETFRNCSSLTGTIPGNLFSGITGVPAKKMFQTTFRDCSGLTGSIPSTLFAGISGAPASSMFWSTFRDCSGLTGSIPSTLFAGISGAPAQDMFYGTFLNCTGLTGSIPENLFAGISGAPVEYMFDNTFNGCTGLTGFTDGTTTTSYIPESFLSSINTDTSVSNQVTGMFTGTGLADPCPANTYAVTREQFSDAVKPWCAPCPTGTHYNGTGATSVNQCCQSGYDWNGTTCASLTISLSYTDELDDTIYDGPASCNINETFILPPAPTKTGYTFAGWTLVEN